MSVTYTTYFLSRNYTEEIFQVADIKSTGSGVDYA